MSTFVLDTTVLIAVLRGEPDTLQGLLDRSRAGHVLSTTCVNIAEAESGALPKERRSLDALVDRLKFLPTTREAATRAGRYQRDHRRRGRTIHAPDALIAGTARAYGAVLLTDDVADFPMPDLRVECP
jgi:predicted nucleic acid-binding protein